MNAALLMNPQVLPCAVGTQVDIRRIE